MTDVAPQFAPISRVALTREGISLDSSQDELCRLADDFLSAAANKRAAHELERLTP